MNLGGGKILCGISEACWEPTCPRAIKLALLLGRYSEGWGFSPSFIYNLIIHSFHRSFVLSIQPVIISFFHSYLIILPYRQGCVYLRRKRQISQGSQNRLRIHAETQDHHYSRPYSRWLIELVSDCAMCMRERVSEWTQCPPIRKW